MKCKVNKRSEFCLKKIFITLVSNVCMTDSTLQDNALRLKAVTTVNRNYTKTLPTVTETKQGVPPISCY